MRRRAMRLKYNLGEYGMDLSGIRIRNIRLTRPLGHGGVGEVWQGHDETLDRQLAVKVLRQERRLDDRSRVRFLREAQILARLEHPNICRAVDYVPGDELDFLILELVDGRTLREVLADGLDRAHALILAEQIASALAAAHAVSVVHRDLKPANIMVTAAGEVKILDFGLARTVESVVEAAADDHLPGDGGGLDAAGFTVTNLGDIMGTPSYMSPEQARGETVTAASDVYSFGLLLQEMLTGKAPFGGEEKIEVLLQRASWGDRETPQGIPRPLVQLIEWMTELKPVRRPTAAEVRLRLGWIRDTPRRRLRWAAASAVALALAGATVVSAYGFMRARAAQAAAEVSAREARTAQADAEAVSSFLGDMLASADPGELGREVMVVDVLDRAAGGLEERFPDQPLRRAALLDTLGVTYHALGMDREAETLLVGARDLRAEQLGAVAVETLSTRLHLGEVVASLDRQEEAEEQLRATAADCSDRLGADHQLTVDTTASLALVLAQQRRFEEAEGLFRSVLEARRRTLPADHPDLLDARVMAGKMETTFNRWESAEEQLVPAMRDARAALGEEHPVTISAINAVANLYDRMERFDEAEGVASEAADLANEVLGPDHPRTLTAEMNVAIQLIRHRKYEAAVKLLRPLTARQEALLGAVHHTHLEGLRALAFALGELGQVDEAGEIMTRRWQIARRALGEEHRVTLENRSGVAAHMAFAGHSAEAEAIYREVLAARRRLFGDDHESTRRSAAALARLLRSTGRDGEAEELLAELGG